MKPIYTLYGIPNCDTVKKARKWLTERHIDYIFHDFKTVGIPAELSDWMTQLGWEALLKKTGTTWRNLPESDKQELDVSKALPLMQTHYNLIKRPLVVANGQIVLTGFKESEWEQKLVLTH
jgi:Spx/MgsR family transcriptional regulator